MEIFIGLDIGTVSVKAVCVLEKHSVAIQRASISGLSALKSLAARGENGDEIAIFLSPYRRIHGNPLDAAKSLLAELLSHFPEEKVISTALTGSAGQLVASTLRLPHYSEFRALATGVNSLYPNADAIFEMGGENSKYLKIAPHKGSGGVGIADYGTNGDCAAGTGSFMDQQASRLLYDIEQIGELVASTENGVNIAGRCSVFAKSDMIHAQQKGATPPQVLKGLCEAVARNFKGNVVKGRKLDGRTAFVGGVANNRGVFEAMCSIFEAHDEELFVPEEPAFYTALGAALLERLAKRNGTKHSIAPAVKAEREQRSFDCWPRLCLDNVRLLGRENSGHAECFSAKREGPSDAFLGVDIGSVSTNLVLTDAEGEVLHEIYLKTKARPIQVVNQGLRELDKIFGDKVRVCGVGTTGSGRELIGELIGADTINDEITAHKTGAARVASRHLDSQVDTIFEIGGQDAKFIRLDEGVVVDFAMNEACAAGTGSFLEEQAEKMGVAIAGEFAERALRSTAPVRLGERCTVFMEMDVTACLSGGADKDDVIGGLAYSVVQNYLNRVVRGRPIGETIFFQGGTAYNEAVAAAFSIVLDKTVIIPPHNGVMGAYGAALLALEKMRALAKPSSFRGFDIEAVHYEVREFSCKACSNRCDIQEFNVEGQKTYWGDKCSERYRKKTKTKKQPVIRDLPAFRAEALERDWIADFLAGKHGSNLARLAERAKNTSPNKGRKQKFGMMRAMYFYQRHPFWRTYLEALGSEVSLSPVTTKRLADESLMAAVAEPCFPIQVAHGHLMELARMEVDLVVIPSHINESTADRSVESHLCPWGQTLPFVLRHSPASKGVEDKLLFPIVHFRQGERFVENELWPYFGQWSSGRKHHQIAVRLGYAAQEFFQSTLLNKGRVALEKLDQTGESGIVLVGRPYNIYDPGLNLNLPAKLRKLYGSNVIPLDFIYTDSEALNEIHPNMYWNHGRKILRTALWTKRQPRLHLIHVTNFKCGPDSFLKTFASDGAGKPMLTLQFDAHSSDTGMMTRCEAFLDSKGLLRWWQ